MLYHHRGHFKVCERNLSVACLNVVRYCPLWCRNLWRYTVSCLSNLNVWKHCSFDGFQFFSQNQRSQRWAIHDWFCWKHLKGSVGKTYTSSIWFLDPQMRNLCYTNIVTTELYLCICLFLLSILLCFWYTYSKYVAVK